MAINHLRQFNAQAHQHNRPNDGVETNDFLSYQMYIGRPEFFEFFRIIHNASSGEVVHQSIEPYVHHMLRVKWHLNAPGEAGTGYAKVFQAALDELNHFISTGFWLDERRVFFDIFQPTVGILGHFEEIGFFTDPLQRTAAIGAHMIFVQFVFWPEGFARYTVPAFVFSFVNISVVIGTLEQHLHHFLMTFFGGTNEVIIGNIQFFPKLLEHANNLIGVFNRGNPCFFGFLFNLLAVFIRTGQEKDIIAVQTLETSHAVRNGCAIGMSDVQFRTGVVNRGGNVVLWFFAHEKFLLYEITDDIVSSAIFHLL